MELFTILMWIGITSVVVRATDLIKRMLPYFTPPLDINDRYIKGKKDVWAVVTGASEGIGKDWAIALSNKGFNIILIARTVSKLEEVAKQLNPAVLYKIIPKDFSKCDDESFIDDLKKELSEYKIGALINNVGVIDVERYNKITPQTIKNHIKINMMSVSLMVLGLFERIYQDAKRENRKGIVVFMSSYSAEQPAAYYQLYASTKKYILQFSQSLRSTYINDSGDYKNYINFLTIRPYFIKTQMVNFKSPPFTITPEKFIQSALGLFGKVQEASGSVSHEINSFITSLLPEFVQDIVVPLITWDLVVKLGFKKAD